MCVTVRMLFCGSNGNVKGVFPIEVVGRYYKLGFGTCLKFVLSVDQFLK